MQNDLKFGEFVQAYLSLTIKLICGWNINAGGIRFEVIARDPISASALTATYVAVLTDAATSFDLVRSAQIGKKLGMAVDINDILRADVAGCDWQKARGLDIADMRNKQETIPVVDAARWTIESIRVLEAGTL